MKSLIVFYSLTGNCKKKAEELKGEYSADILELKFKKGFTKAKMNFSNMLIGGFQAATKKTPKINHLDINLNNYNQIIIGTPVWASNITPPIRTFLKNNIIKNKKIILFISFKGEIGNSISELKEILKENEIIKIIECKE